MHPHSSARLKVMSVAIVTCEVLPEPDPDEELLMSALADAGLDPALAKHFIRSVGIYPRDCSVILTNGDPAIVEEPNPDDPLRPKVLLPQSGNTILDLRETQVGIRRCVDTGRKAFRTSGLS